MYKRTVARIGVQLPRWLRVERKISALGDEVVSILDPNIDRASGRTGEWAVVEDSKLRDAVEETHGGENWAGIAVLFQSISKNDMSGRTNIDWASRCTDAWSEDEDIK
jgi:hypothetical protein